MYRLLPDYHETGPTYATLREARRAASNWAREEKRRIRNRYPGIRIEINRWSGGITLDWGQGRSYVTIAKA